MTTRQPETIIVIRGAEADDWEEIAEVLSGANVIYNTCQLPYQSRDKVRERMENPREGVYSLIAEVDDTAVGLLGLTVGEGRRAHAASLGMMVHADYQGQGVGSALMAAVIELAEKWLNVSRIELEVFPDNTAALALYRKFGFEIEGTMHASVFRDGEYIDSYLMARIRDESTDAQG